MSELKITTTVSIHDKPDVAALAYRVAYWVGLAHVSLPQTLKPFFRHLGVAIYSFEDDFASIDVTLSLEFEYLKKCHPGYEAKTKEEARLQINIKPRRAWFLVESQKDSTVSWLREELLTQSERPVWRLENDLAGAGLKFGRLRTAISEARLPG